MWIPAQMACYAKCYTASMRLAFICRNHFSIFILPDHVGARCHLKKSKTLTTVSKRACRSFLQLIHVKCAAVLDFNVIFPASTILCPMIANFTSHFTVCHRGMLSFDPSWGMRTTTTLRWACSGHLWVTSNTNKAIPARSDISLITSDLALSSERFETVGCIEALVVAARVIRCNCWNNRCEGSLRRLPLYRIPNYSLFLNTLQRKRIILDKKRWKGKDNKRECFVNVRFSL